MSAIRFLSSPRLAFSTELQLNAPPEDGPLATVVPINPVVKLSAAAAENDV